MPKPRNRNESDTKIPNKSRKKTSPQPTIKRDKTQSNSGDKSIAKSDRKVRKITEEEYRILNQILINKHYGHGFKRKEVMDAIAKYARESL